jgi:hypothetical protein
VKVGKWGVLDLPWSEGRFYVCDTRTMIAKTPTFHPKIAHDIWGKDVTSMRGKTKKKSTVVADLTIRVPIVQQQQVLSVDIMFVESIPSLIAVATPLDLVLAVSLKLTDMDKAQRTAAAVKEGLDNMVGTMSGQGYFSDGEGAVGKLKNHLNSM